MVPTLNLLQSKKLLKPMLMREMLMRMQLIQLVLRKIRPMNLRDQHQD